MAKLEKARKKFKDMAIELGEKLNPAMLRFTNTSTLLIKSIGVLIDFFGRYGGVLIKTVALIGIYVTAVKLQTFWTTRFRDASILQIATEKLKHFWTLASLAATQLYAAATMLLTGNIKGAAQAMRVFNSVVKANPLALLVTIIAAAGLALYEFAKGSRKASDTYSLSIQEIAQAQREHIRQVQEEKSEINHLISSITKVNTSVNTRKKLLQELKEKYPDYLRFIDIEKVSNDELLLVLQKVNGTYSERLRMAGLRGKAEAYNAKILEMQTRYIEVEERLSQLGRTGITPGTKLEKEWQELNEEERLLSAKIATYNEKVTELSDQAVKIQEQIEHSFTADGIREEIENMTKYIATANQQLQKASTEEEKTFYQNQLDKLIAQKKLLEKQLAEAVKKEKDDTKTLNIDTPLALDADLDDKLLKKRMTILEEAFNAEKNLLKEQRILGKLDKDAYETAIYEAELKFQERKIALLRKFGKDTSEVEAKILDEQIKIIDAVEKELLKGLEGIGKELEAIDKEISTSLSKDIAAGTQKSLKKAIAGAEEFRKQMQELSRDAERVRSSLSLSPKEQHAKEMKELNRIYKSGLLKHEEYNQAKRKIDKTYNDARLAEMMAGIEVGNAALGAASAFYEMQKQRELRTAGDNEAAKEAIERKYFEKNKNTRIAEARISGALAIMRIWEGTISGNPVVDAAIKAALTVAQIATTEFQVKAMKEQTYAGSGSGTSENGDIKRVITGRESGGYWEVEREQDGKLFQADYKPNDRGFMNKPTVLVGESGTEFVINKEGVENPTIKPVLDIIDIAQKQGTITTLNLPGAISSRVPGRASGGSFTEQSTFESSGNSKTRNTTMDPEYKALMKEVKALLTDLKNNGVKAPVVLSELERIQELKRRSDKLGNR